MKKVNLVPFQNHDFKKINEFINHNLIDTLDLDEALNELLKLAYFLEENAANFNHSLIYEIVIDNEILCSLLDTITSNIDLNDMENILDNEMALNLVRAYLMQKGIIPLDREEFKDNLDFDYYLKDYDIEPSIKKEVDLNRQERNAFFKKANKSEEDIWLLFTNYYYTIFNRARFICRGKLPFNDLLGESEIILLEAIKNFDTEKIPFFNYLISQLNYYLNNYIKKNGSYNHIANYVQNKIGNLKKIIYDCDKNGLTVSKDKLAKDLDCDVSDIDYYMTLSESFIDYDDFVSDENVPNELTSLADEPFEDKILSQMYKPLSELLIKCNLSNFKRNIIYQFYEQGIKDEDIAKNSNCSRQNINQIRRNALLEIFRSEAFIREIDYVDNYLQLWNYFKKNITLENIIINHLIIDYQNMFEICHLNEEEREVCTALYGLNGEERIPMKTFAKMKGKKIGYIFHIRNSAFYKIVQSNYNLPYLDLIPDLDSQIDKLKTYTRKRNKS